MRLVFTADVHIDHDRWGDRRSGGPIDSAWLSAAKCLGTAADLACETGAGLVIAGDLFLNGNPLPEAVELAADQTRKVLAAGMPVVILPGNHDQDGVPVGQRLVVERFADLGATVISEPGITCLEDGTQIAALPWLWRSRLISELGMGEATGDEIDDAIADELVHHVSDLADQVDSRRGPVVLAGHAVLDTATFNSGNRASELALRRHLREPVLPLASVLEGPWDLAVFGHIHAQQSFADGRVWIPGSPDRIDFGDENHGKGVLLFDPDTGVTNHRTPARDMLTVGSQADLAKLAAGVLVRAEIPSGDLDVPANWRKAITEAEAVLVQSYRKPRKAVDNVEIESSNGDLAGVSMTDLVQTWARNNDCDDQTASWLESAVDDFRSAA